MTIDEIKSYLEKIPTPAYYDNLSSEEQTKLVFNAQEEINDVLIGYPNVSPTVRMYALQAIYNAEGEDEGIAMMRRQGIKDYAVKDVKAVLDKDIISPAAFALIEAFNAQEQSNKMRVGRLI
ncbi:hypothetical protein [Staphylococcus simulans]|uniref:hypothetical protein n=1 Tax=Staphylococcus simulans TaxID=1286 RepID=UPI003CE99728